MGHSSTPAHGAVRGVCCLAEESLISDHVNEQYNLEMVTRLAEAMPKRERRVRYLSHCVVACPRQSHSPFRPHQIQRRRSVSWVDAVQAAQRASTPQGTTQDGRVAVFSSRTPAATSSKGNGILVRAVWFVGCAYGLVTSVARRERNHKKAEPPAQTGQYLVGARCGFSLTRVEFLQALAKRSRRRLKCC